MRHVPAILVLILGLLTAGSAQAAKTLEIYFIDTEGGQATLIVSPSGQALLVDTGFGANAGRDALRIAKAAKAAGVKKIDTLLITHFHSDHAGGVKNLMEKFPVSTFLDHGVSVEDNKYPAEYEAAFGTGQHQVIVAGQQIPIKGLDVTVLAAAGKNIQSKSEANSFCAGVQPTAADDPGNAGENPQSAAIMVQFGKFRFLDPGDLPWNRELSLVCPENLLGKIDLYLTTHHGAESPEGIYGMAPRVAIMNNGPRKGGDAGAMKRIAKSPGLEDLWQLHYAIAAGKDANAPDTLIANVDEQCEGLYLKVVALEDGSFTVTNPRNKYSKTYKAR